jgi:hypothetical protein
MNINKISLNVNLSELLSKWLIVSVVSCSSFLVSGQTVSDIKSSGLYNWGIGTGSNYHEARRNALQMLSESITVQITSSFTEVVKETGDVHKSYVEKVVSSYSATRAIAFKF